MLSQQIQLLLWIFSSRYLLRFLESVVALLNSSQPTDILIPNESSCQRCLVCRSLCRRTTAGLRQTLLEKVMEGDGVNDLIMSHVSIEMSLVVSRSCSRLNSEQLFKLTTNTRCVYFCNAKKLTLYCLLGIRSKFCCVNKYATTIVSVIKLCPYYSGFEILFSGLYFRNSNLLAVKNEF